MSAQIFFESAQPNRLSQLLGRLHRHQPDENQRTNNMPNRTNRPNGRWPHSRSAPVDEILKIDFRALKIAFLKLHTQYQRSPRNVFALWRLFANAENACSTSRFFHAITPRPALLGPSASHYSRALMRTQIHKPYHQSKHPQH